MDENRFERMEKDVEVIKARNLRVEADKAWETSGIRIFSIVVITYIIAAFVMHVIGVKNFMLNALIPTLGYYLSTQSLPFIKRWWVRAFMRKKDLAD